jgi:nucleoside-diphosphate kinase
MERSLIIIKPDGVQRGLVGTILNRLEKQGLKLMAIKMLRLDKTLAQQLYAPHKDKPFFSRLVTYITSAPIIIATFEGDGVVELIRKTMGATDPAQARRKTIRGVFGLDIERNTIHGSDSTETARREIRLFFSDDEIF